MGYSWSELETIFQTALKLPEKDRIEYVKNQAEGNSKLEQTVLSMLKESENANHYFDKLQVDIAQGFEERKEDIFNIGDTIDKYVIKEKLGEGGMSQVYLAERNDQQYDQLVAIKCFSISNEKHDLFKNFQKERQFLAKLNHPNIAHILDGGVTDHDIHYIIMEYVDGMPLVDYINHNNFDLKSKLKIFKKICNAINYAHNHLILHLDIKPSNVYVNKEGSIKLLDFGIAQKIGEPLADRYFLASPLYASPEQIKNKTISVASDIYQLGILLHQILSGKLPFKSRENSLKSNKELILSQDSIDKELLSIIKNCLKENPDERYLSVSSLIQDIDFFLDNKAIAVHSKSVFYQGKKFFIRNKIKMSLAILLLISMTMGIIFTSHQAEIAKKNELKAKKTSEFLLDIFNNANPNLTKGSLTVKEILDNSTKSIENKFDEREFKLTLYAQLIDIYTNVYLWEDSKKLAEKVLTDYTDLYNYSSLIIMSNLASNYRELSEYKKADSVFSKVVSSFEIIPVTPEFKVENYLAYGKLKQIESNYDSALQLLHKADSITKMRKTRPKEAADIFNHYASVYKDLSKYDTALSFQKKAINTISDIDGPEYQNSLSIYYNNQGNIYEKLSLYDSAILAFENSIQRKRQIQSKPNLDLAITYSNLGGAYYKKEAYDSASKYLNTAITIFSIELEPDNNFIISSRYSLANIYYSQQQFKKAFEEYKLILQADTNNFGSEHPYVADDYISLANCQREMGELNKALKNLKRAEVIINNKFDKSHQKTSYLNNKFGMLYEAMENYTLAQLYYQQSYDLAFQYLGSDHRYTKLYKEDVERVSKIMKASIKNM